MRMSDLLWMALKTLQRRLLILPAAAIAISTFCLCFAGAVIVTVQQEKSLPYELEVTTESVKLSERTLAKLSGIMDVTAVTPVFEVPASVVAGGYKAQLTLTGIDASYIDEAFEQGGVFPDSSAMPYIVLNKAACKLFRDEKNDGISAEESQVPPIDWLNAAVNVLTSEETKPVVSKIVGLLPGDDEDQKPVAYISVASAKNLLSHDGQSTYMSAKVRVDNIGCAADVSQEIKSQGFNVSNANEDAALVWDKQLTEVTYLILLGISCLIIALVYTCDRIQLSRYRRKDVFAALQWMGLKHKDARRMFIFQSMVIAILGVTIGIIVSVFAPSFIVPEAQKTTIFFLQIPFEIIAICGFVCMIVYILPIFLWRMRLNT